MMGIGFPELMVILVIIMIIFGAGKLPEIGSAFGRSIKNFKTSMKEAEEVSSEEAEPVAEVEAGTESTDAGQEPAGQEPAAQEPAAQESAAPADPGIAKTEQTAPPPASPNPVKAQAKKPAPAPAKAPPAKAKSVKKAAKSEEEKMIEDAINELKSRRIGTIKTPHDGLVQQGDVFTESVKRNPWGRKTDRGVRRDVL